MGWFWLTDTRWGELEGVSWENGASLEQDAPSLEGFMIIAAHQHLCEVTDDVLKDQVPAEEEKAEAMCHAKGRINIHSGSRTSLCGLVV